MSEKLKREEILKEINDLCNTHGDSLADFKKCRDFNRRLALFLMNLEDSGYYQIADRVMDALAGCNPKEGSRCEDALSLETRLKMIKERIKEEMNGA
jgi:hypothetical protein